MKHGLFEAGLLLSLFAAYHHAAANGPGCDSISTSIVKNDTSTTETKCDENGYRRVIRKTNGREDGKWEVYGPGGRLESLSTFKNGVADGLFEIWYSDGTPYERKSYRNGRLIDTVKLWYDKGTMNTLEVYDTAGQKKGWSMDWAENGNLEDSVYYVKGEKKEGYFFCESGKLMLYGKTRWNPRTRPYDGYYHGPYDILEAASFDSTGRKNGEVKGGNGRIIVLSACNGTSDTLDIKGTHVRRDGYYDGYLDVNIYGLHGFHACGE